MTIERLVILHGYFAEPSAHWFPWLSAQLEARGGSASVPALPDSAAPELDAWRAAALEAIGTPDERLAVVGHSLGAITALHALDAIEGDWRLGAYVAVAGFLDQPPGLDALAPFTATTPDVARTVARTGTLAVVQSDNDGLVPPELGQRLAAELGVELTVVPGAGHFLGDEGVTELPVVAELLGAA